jgi:hypothetical protein
MQRSVVKTVPALLGLILPAVLVLAARPSTIWAASTRPESSLNEDKSMSIPVLRKTGVGTPSPGASKGQAREKLNPNNNSKAPTGVGQKNQKYYVNKKIVKHAEKIKYSNKLSSHSNYHKKYGKKFSYYSGSKKRDGWYYPGRKHYHWSHYCWNTHYRRWFFYDDCTRCYYYFSSRNNCYLPSDCGCSPSLEDSEDDCDTPPCYVDYEEFDGESGVRD